MTNVVRFPAARRVPAATIPRQEFAALAKRNTQHRRSGPEADTQSLDVFATRADTVPI
ncbi:hypothetical protein [Methylobacterium segetis]|uniref:hypothetical protein n=1 Tax=Methylobacterium segetis TaxID=2488750 RepID=UPI00140440CB|nr:hypothetical protein [Methylobacterium segetis]